jgi:pyridoxamine 5'-phosphate oxidase
MMNSKKLADLRREYSREVLDVDTVQASPFEQFGLWMDEALNADLPEPTAMTLATVSADGLPSARIVLLKGVDSGLLFYTNYESEKGRHLEANPNAAIVFHWPELERQVRLAGIVTKVSNEESESYFASRPHNSQLGAWASHQSEVIASRAE